MTEVVVLQHVHTLPHGDEDTKLLGVYATRGEAELAIERFRLQPGFRERPELRNALEDGPDVDGFYISNIVMGLDYWEDGYETR